MTTNNSLFTVTVNGQPATLDVAPETPLSEILAPALASTDNERWGRVERWECRDSRGELLGPAVALGDVTPNERGISVWIQLKPGVFA